MITLKSYLQTHPAALVAAIGTDGRPAPVPDSVPLCGQRGFANRSGLELVAAADQIAAIEAWERSFVEAFVSLQVHLFDEPDQSVRICFFDARAEYGVHLLFVESDNPDALLAAADARSGIIRLVAHVHKDAAAVILEVDDAAVAMLGWTAAELVGRRTVEFVHPDDVQRAIDSWMEMRSDAGSGRVRLRYRHATGRFIWVEITNHNRLDDPEFGCIVSEMVDISDEMAQLEALRDRERLLGRLAEALPIGICHLRLEGEIAYANEPLRALLGAVDSVDALIQSIASADRPAVGLALEHVLQGRPSALEVSVIHGLEERRCELTFRTMTSDSGHADGVIMCAADVTDRSRLRSELEHRASHDALSGCLNRAATVAALERVLREGGPVGVAYIDLDHFKATNDELGHAAGDELLRVVAARIRSAARVDDQIGRIGGDEFVVICRQGENALDPAALVIRLTTAINGDVVFARQRIPLQASVGATVSVEGEVDAEAVLTRADAAMYKAKRRSRVQSASLHAVRSVPS